MWGCILSKYTTHRVSKFGCPILIGCFIAGYILAECDWQLHLQFTLLPLFWRRCVFHTCHTYHTFYTHVLFFFVFTCKGTIVQIYSCFDFIGCSISVKICCNNSDFSLAKNPFNSIGREEFNQFISRILKVIFRLFPLKICKKQWRWLTNTHLSFWTNLYSGHCCKLTQSLLFEENKTLTCGCALGEGLVLGAAALGGDQDFHPRTTRLSRCVVCTQ